MEKSSEIAELDNGSAAETHQRPSCGCLIISSPLIGGVLFCLLVLILLDNTLDRGQCTSARSTPTSPPIQVGAPIDIQSKLPNRTLPRISASNAMNLMELGQITSLPIRIRKLSFNPDNTLSVINDTTWLDTHWSDIAVDPQGKTIVYIEGTPSEPSIVRGCDIESKRQIFAFSSDETANQVRQP